MANFSLNGLRGSGLSAPILSKTINNNYIKNDNDVNINQDYIEVNYSDPNAETLINPNADIEHPMQKYMKTDINPYAAGVELENVRAEAAAFGVSVAFGLLDVVENIGDALIMAGALISVGEASIFHPEDVEDIKKTASDIVSYDWTEGLYDASVDAMGIDYESSHGVAHSIGTVGGTMLGYTALSIGTSGAGAVVNAAVGGLSAMGSSSERALQSGATFEQAEITGLVAGGLGAATGVASEKIRTAASGARSIGDIAKYTAAGAGVAASEPIANSAVEYITYGKNNSDNIFDYYMNNGGFQSTLMAAGIGGASTAVKATQGYKENLKNTGIDKKNFSENSIKKINDTTTVESKMPKLVDSEIKDFESIKISSIDEGNPTLKIFEDVTPTLKIFEDAPPTVDTFGEKKLNLDIEDIEHNIYDKTSNNSNEIQYFQNSTIGGSYKKYDDYDDYVKVYSGVRKKWEKGLNKNETDLIRAYIGESCTSSYKTVNGFARGTLVDIDQKKIIFKGIYTTNTYSFTEYENLYGISVQELLINAASDAKTLNQAISKSQLIEDTVLFRGVGQQGASTNSFFRQYGLDYTMSIEKIADKIVGKEFLDKGFMSCTPIEKLSIVRDKPVKFVLYCKKGMPCADFSNFNSLECETLLGMGQKFEIKNVYKNGKQIVVEMYNK